MSRYYRRRRRGNNNNELINLLFKGLIYFIALPVFIVIWIIKLTDKQKIKNNNINSNNKISDNKKVILNEKGKKYNLIKHIFLITTIILFGLFIYFAYGLKLNGYACPITLILSICTIIVTAVFDKLAKKESYNKENYDCNNYPKNKEQQNINLQSVDTNKSQYHIKVKTITDNEKYFLDIIKKHFGKDYDIRVQVPLSSIIEKEKDFENQYQNELNRVIDIGIFDKETTYPLLLIEINDSTHHRKDRQVRDAKVKNICEQANLKLIAFWTEYSNTEEYVFNRINENLGR